MTSPPDDTTDDFDVDFDFGGNVDMDNFAQVLDMDDDEDSREFSRSIVFGFFAQAVDTFSDMDTDIQNKNLQALSEKGHFLKGSSATLGFTKIKDECEKIQNYGRKKDETGTNDVSDEEKLLRLIEDALAEAKRSYKVIEALMKKFYNEAKNPKKDSE